MGCWGGVGGHPRNVGQPGLRWFDTDRSPLQPSPRTTSASRGLLEMQIPDTLRPPESPPEGGGSHTAVTSLPEHWGVP